MGSRRDTRARETWRELRRQVREAAAAVERAALWVHALPEVPEWFEHWVECASELATKRQDLARAREVVRGERIRKVLRRREELAGPREPVFTPLPPLRQAALFFGALTPAPTRPAAPALPPVEPGPREGATLERLARQGSYRPLSRASLTGVPCGRCVPCFKGCHCTKGTDGTCQCGAVYGEPGAFARSLSSPPEPEGPPSSSSSPEVRDAHELPAVGAGAQPPAAEAPQQLVDGPPADDVVQLHADDLVHVEELPAGFCELCERERPGVMWSETRGMRLCPAHWPAEALVQGVAA